MNIDLINEQILYFTNLERKKRGKDPLIQNIVLNNAAQLHCVNMVKFNFFSHDDNINFGLKTHNDRIKHEGGKFLISGENLAKMPLFELTGGILFPRIFGIRFGINSLDRKIDEYEYAENTVKALMLSPGHRLNILYNGYNYLGVGTAIYQHKEITNSYGISTQNFGA